MTEPTITCPNCHTVIRLGDEPVRGCIGGYRAAPLAAASQYGAADRRRAADQTEMVYQYLTGPRFRHRVEAIVEAFSSMQADLDRERKAIMKQWAKREEQIERVMNATVGMYGDLQGIAGKSLREIEGLSFVALAGSNKDNQGSETL